MAQVTIEYMIMVPVLILQIFLFPLTATVIMDVWADQRRSLELKDIAGHLGSSVQQLYFSINRASSGSLTMRLDTPPSIDGLGYTITLHNATSPNPEGSAKILNLTLCFMNDKGSTSTLVPLGENAVWHNNVVYFSNVTTLNATKVSSEIWLTLMDGGA
jgi:hypothetical protein